MIEQVFTCMRKVSVNHYTDGLAALDRTVMTAVVITTDSASRRTEILDNRRRPRGGRRATAVRGAVAQSARRRHGEASMRSSITAALILSFGLAGCSSKAADAPRRVPAAPGASAAIRLNAHLLVDQFGYRPADPKVAVIRNPRAGYDSADHFEPGTAYEVRSVADGAVVYSGHPEAWRHGELQASSGDSGWWFDFGTVRKPGSYFVFDVQRGVRSATFAVGEDVYKPILRAAVRMYFYQRSGFPKHLPHAQACWVDEPAYVGRGQDTEAHDITDRDNKAKVRNLAGGWFDAGDTNKYVTFAATAVHQLLTAYQNSPAAFGDDTNIPESGNGIPREIDEV